MATAGSAYLDLVLSQLEPCSLGRTSIPKVSEVRSWSSHLPWRRMLTDRLLAHRRMQVSSPSWTQTSRQLPPDSSRGRSLTPSQSFIFSFSMF